MFDAEAVEGTSYTGSPLTRSDMAVKASEFREIKQIRATGQIEDSRNIGFIGEGGPAGRALFSEMSVYMNAASGELVEKGYSGVLLHMTGDVLHGDDHKEPYLALELYVPQATFEKAWVAVRSGAASRMHLRIYVAVFRCEVDRSLADPWMYQTYYIEDDSSNAVAFNMLTVTYPKTMQRRIEPMEEGVEPTPGPEPQRVEDPLVMVMRRNVAVMNQVARHLKFVAASVVAIAVLMAIALLR